MPDEFKDVVSGILSNISNILMLDAPKRTVYGVLLGLSLFVTYEVIIQVVSTDIVISWYHFVIIGLLIINITTIWAYLTGRNRISEKYEEKFEVIRRAKESGLSKEHTKIQLLEVCQMALKESVIEEEVKRRIDEAANKGASELDSE